MAMASSQSLLENNVSQASNEFGVNVLNAITAANDGNHVISPLSLTTALGMVHLGARGETNDELRQLLGYNAYNIADSEAHNAYNNLLQQIRDANHSQFVLNVANRVMAQNELEILADYSNLLQINYDASIQEVDFVKNGENAIKTINEWVAHKTNNKITSLFEKPLSPLTRLVVVNAVYLKANWLHKFNPSNTTKATFFNNGNTKVTIDMMCLTYVRLNITASNEYCAEILEIPYIGGDISMYIVLPFTVNGLQKTASALTAKKFNFAIKCMSSMFIILYLPKFKIELSYTLTEQLKSLGLVNIFTENADLSGINGHRDLYVSDVVHKVFLSVDESGTEASAATVFEAAGYGSSRVIPPPKEFKVDYPFILVIRNNKTNHNLFYGQISQL